MTLKRGIHLRGMLLKMPEILEDYKEGLVLERPDDDIVDPTLYNRIKEAEGVFENPNERVDNLDDFVHPDKYELGTEFENQRRTYDSKTGQTRVHDSSVLIDSFLMDNDAFTRYARPRRSEFIIDYEVDGMDIEELEKAGLEVITDSPATRTKGQIYAS